MASLLGKNINETYEGLLKTDNNSQFTGSTQITDGLGNNSALTLGTASNGSSFNGSLTVNTNILACNNLTTNNNLCVKGSSVIDNNLIVTGDTIVAGISASNFKFNGAGSFNGAISFNNSISVAGTSTMVDTTINGDLTVNGTINSSGDIIAFSTSDSRLKDNLKPIQSDTYINNLTGYEFDWNSRSKRKGKGKGIIAEDLYKVDKSLVRENGDGYLTVDYMSLIPVLLEEVKRLGKELHNLKKTQLSTQ